jgi:hypothetical protein
MRPLPAEIAPQTTRSFPLLRFLRSHTFWLTILAAQFAVWQLLLGVQYGDAARNLHWGMVVAENPRFLIGDRDPYEMVTGFIPNPPTLAPAGGPRAEYAPFNPLWGPVPLLLMAAAWGLTESHVLEALVVPAAAGLTVIASYCIGRQLFDKQVGIVTAVFLALFPLFFERAIISYGEVMSALFMTLAIWAYLRNRTTLAALMGILTVLCKVNMGPLYCGVIGCSLIYRLCYRRDRRSLIHCLVALVAPALALMLWSWFRTGDPLPSAGGPLLLSMFKVQSLNMLQMLFYIPWYGAILTLSIIGVCAAMGLRSPRLGAQERVIFVSWIALGVVALLIYMATPYLDNSPRVLLPSLPAVALLVAEGWRRLAHQWARRIAFYLIALFVVVNSCIIYYDTESMRYTQTFTELWQVLREQPRGFTLTPAYWPTLWQTRQPVTWFDGDRQFEANILHNRANFVRYTTEHPIRYIVVPRAGTAAAVSQPLIQVETSHLYSDDVLDYLRQHTRHIPVPPYYDLYVLPTASP